MHTAHHISLYMFVLRLRLRSTRVVDTLGHASTPIFSVGCRFFSLFPGHTNGLQVLAYGINPVFPRSSCLRLTWWSICQYMACFGILSSSMRSTWPSHLSLLSLMIRFISFKLVRCLTSSLRTLSFQDTPNSHRWNLWWATSGLPVFFCCTADKGYNSAPYNSVDMTWPEIHTVFRWPSNWYVCSSIYYSVSWTHCWLCNCTIHWKTGNDFLLHTVPVQHQIWSFHLKVQLSHQITIK